jgi:hypothetical protein
MEKIDPIYNIYILIKDGDIINAKNEMNNIPPKIILKNMKGYNSLKLRLLIIENDLDGILTMLESDIDLMSRDWVDFLIYINNQKIFDEYLDKYLDKIININYNTNNITDLYNNLDKPNFYNFIKHFEYKSLSINIQSNINENKQSFYQRLLLPNYYKEDILQLQIKKFNISINIESNNYKYILDGGNILYSNKGKLNNNSYKTLLNIYNNYSKKDKTLIILNKKHQKFINNINNINTKNYNIYFSPYKENDDLYILYFSLLNKAFIVSNDEYSDHIDKYSIKEPNMNFLKIYLEEKLINHIINNNNHITNNFTKVVQINDKSIYIPNTNIINNTLHINII